jgi:hypothetical protein
MSLSLLSAFPALAAEVISDGVAMGARQQYSSPGHQISSPAVDD